MASSRSLFSKVKRHHKSINKNLCANIVRHDYLVTGKTKAMRAQPKIESFLSKMLARDDELVKQGITDLDSRLSKNQHLNYVHEPLRKEIGSKVLTELKDRYKDRSAGFTRIIRLEPRLSEDKAAMSVIELVDSEFEIKYWFVAKVVARLQLQGLELDALTKRHVEKLTKLRPDGIEKFQNDVEIAKKQFFSYNEETEEVEDELKKKELENLPNNLSYNGGILGEALLASKKFPTKSRPSKEPSKIPLSPFLANSN
ncbi:uncharacterized protein KQ657_004893 [Scheffersomyces spartinae]|uniref:Uncharacterized protein n=1 Tax=Scheffersomyces spartinae TaxID=45513 RepID=A0A9P7VA57_9ASCO|nr:uncharacterized protein KQ657_004893 [Scheffersomyces spartinae]KAG7194183.1 hypothetical protein KQ657_004893 [Scheffersomyces spartinae]